MLGRILAVVLLAVGIVGIVVAVGGAVVTYQALDSVVDVVDSLGTAIEQTLDFALDGLNSVDSDATASLAGQVGEINDRVDQTQTNLTNQIRTVRLGLLLIFLWFGLTQLVPLYMGADLITDGKLGSKLLP